MNTVGDPISAEEAYEFGLVNRLVADHELFDTALAWARKFAGQAPVALEQIKQVSHAGDLDEGIEAEKAAFTDGLRVRGRARGHRRVPAEAQAGVQGPVSGPRKRGLASSLREHRGDHDRLAELIRSAGSVVALTGAGISVPSGIPDFRSPGSGLWANVDPMEVAHIYAWRRDPRAVLGVLRPALRDARGQAAERRRIARWRSSTSRSSPRTSTACTPPPGLKM